MGDRSKNLDPYLVEHIRDALAQDPRVSELDVTVEIDDETVVLSGTVASPERQKAAADIAHRLLPDHEVRNETAVTDFEEQTDVEHFS